MANSNPDQSGLGPPFSKENQPANRGRKPSSVKKYIKDNNLNYNDVSAMAKYILPLKQEQLEKLLLDKKVPFIIRLFAKSVIADMKKGNLVNVMTLVDRAVGKPKEIQEITAEITTPLSREEKQQLIAKLMEKRNGADS